MNWKMRLLLIGVTVAGTAMVMSGLWAMRSRQARGPVVEEREPGDLAEPDPGLEGRRVGDFALVNQDGEPVDQTIFDGKVSIIDFVFTNCPFVCPGMTFEMKGLHDRLQDAGVQLVSFSVDATRDTPARLREFGERHDADFSRWTFVADDGEQVAELVHQIGFELGEDQRTITLADGSTMKNISHPSRLILVDGERRVLGLYSFDNPAHLEALAERARALAGK